MLFNVDLSMIVAAAEGTLIIGRNGGLPWNIPSDLKRFKGITTEIGTIIVGRPTYESMLAGNGGASLPGRIHVVMTTGAIPTQQGPQVFWARSVEQALALVAHYGNNRACVAGGAAVYRLFAPLVQKLYLTLVHGDDITGDTVLEPPCCQNGYAWKRIHSEGPGRWDPRDEYPTSFHVLEKVRAQ